MSTGCLIHSIAYGFCSAVFQISNLQSSAKPLQDKHSSVPSMSKPLKGILKNPLDPKTPLLPKAPLLPVWKEAEEILRHVWLGALVFLSCQRKRTGVDLLLALPKTLKPGRQISPRSFASPKNPGQICYEKASERRRVSTAAPSP